MDRFSDYVYHQPGGSETPGKEIANPYVNFPADRIEKLLEHEKDPEEIKKMQSALKQWERIYTYPGYPFRAAAALRQIAGYLLKKAEITGPSINLPYYQDAETPSGLGEIIDSLLGLYDQDNNKRVDYNRQGERPHRDIDTAEGDFLTPDEPAIGDVVKPRGDGPDPDDTESVEPPTGGDMGKY